MVFTAIFATCLYILITKTQKQKKYFQKLFMDGEILQKDAISISDINSRKHYSPYVL